MISANNHGHGINLHLHHNTHNCHRVPFPDVPLLLELSSRSGAGEWHGDSLGLYHLTTDTREESKRQGPVYRQLHDGDNEQYYLYRWDFSCTLDIYN